MKKKDKVSNEKINETIGFEHTALILCEGKLQCFGHTKGGDKENIGKRVFQMKSTEKREAREKKDQI